MKYIIDGDFCRVVSDKFVSEGVKRNRIVYVAGHKALPISESDPYTQRIKFFVHLTSKGHIITEQLYLMDPSSLEKMKPSDQKRLNERKRGDFDHFTD